MKSKDLLFIVLSLLLIQNQLICTNEIQDDEFKLNLYEAAQSGDTDRINEILQRLETIFQI